MPYFAGEDTTRYALKPDGEAADINEFFELVEKISITEAQLDRFIPVKKSRKKQVTKEGTMWDEAPPCLVHMKLNGIPEGMRNNALLNYGVFLRKVYPEGEDWNCLLYTSDAADE